MIITFVLFRKNKLFSPSLLSIFFAIPSILIFNQSITNFQVRMIFCIKICHLAFFHYAGYWRQQYQSAKRRHYIIHGIESLFLVVFEHWLIKEPEKKSFGILSEVQTYNTGIAAICIKPKTNPKFSKGKMNIMHGAHTSPSPFPTTNKITESGNSIEILQSMSLQCLRDSYFIPELKRKQILCFASP